MSMTIEKAIAIIENGVNAKTYDEQVEAKDIAIKALKKALSMKIKEIHVDESLNELPKAELIELLQTANKKLKRAEQTTKKLRKQVRILRRLKEVLSGVSFYYDSYDDVTDLEFGKLQGRVELKDELMDLINETL